MPKVFRLARTEFIKRGDVRRYITYAVGEIVLVVIGILIALGINNANEGRKSRDFELKMLHEVRNGLVRDTTVIHALQVRLHVVDTSTRIVLDHAEGISGAPAPTMDHVNGLLTDAILHFHRGPYEALRAVGLDRISNDKLRTHLMDVYDFGMPRTLTFFHKEMNLFLSQREAMMDDLLTITLPPDEGTIMAPHWEARSTDLLASTELVTLARYRRLEATNASLRLDHVEQIIVHLLRLLDQELGLDHRTK